MSGFHRYFWRSLPAAADYKQSPPGSYRDARAKEQTMKIGYFLSSEESEPARPHDLAAQAVKGQEAGFDGLWISDHYHPRNDEQGHSPFVWSTIEAIAHATGARMKLTEHIIGARWPEADERLVLSGSGPKSISLAARIGDGYCTVGPAVDRHVETIQACADAGFDELYVNQIGPEQDAFWWAARPDCVGPG
jgi:alkanesulfonate monooxygenase SsuD/methylene tetrahydromethanopterin reductase-like flavin-dependent oxidoreductase (luciferase family)